MNWYKNAKNNRSRFSSWDKTLKAVHDKRDILFLEAEKKSTGDGTHFDKMVSHVYCSMQEMRDDGKM